MYEYKKGSLCKYALISAVGKFFNGSEIENKSNPSILTEYGKYM